MLNLRSKRFRHPFILTLLCVCVLLFSLPLRNVFLTILRRPLVIVTWVRDEFQGVLYFHRNHYENKLLRDEVDVLRTRLVRMEETQQENARLQELLAFRESSDYPLLASRVIGRSADSWSSTLIIDKGDRQGIAKGMGVITRGGFIGRIVQVQPHTSTVLLISDPNLGVSAMCQRSRQEGLVSGTLGRMLIMRYLPDEPDIAAGDLIITSGLAQTYPKGLIIGEVIEVNRDLSGLSYHALIRPAVDLDTVEEVLVILS